MRYRILPAGMTLDTLGRPRESHKDGWRGSEIEHESRKDLETHFHPESLRELSEVCSRSRWQPCDGRHTLFGLGRGMGGRAIEIEVVFLHILAVISFAVG